MIENIFDFIYGICILFKEIIIPFCIIVLPIVIGISIIIGTIFGTIAWYYRKRTVPKLIKEKENHTAIDLLIEVLDKGTEGVDAGWVHRAQELIKESNKL
jgi:hypothetical protein